MGKWWRNGRKRQKKPFKLGQKRGKKVGKAEMGKEKAENERKSIKREEKV